MVQPALCGDAARCTTSAEKEVRMLGSHDHEEMNPHKQCLFLKTRTLKVMANLLSEESHVRVPSLKRAW